MESISLSLPPVDIPQIDLDSRLIDNDYTPKMGVIVITTDDIEAIVALCEEQGATTPAKIAKIAKEYIDTHYLSDIK